MSQYSHYRLDEITQKLNRARFYPLDVMVTGVTGAGKSSTLNALFQREVANVGTGCDPENTKEVQATLWESVTSAASKGASIGRDIGRVFGGVGETIGAAVGGFVGGVCGAIGSLFGW